ncbi:hypothetical protein P3S68_017226 [Capsicum galapagoense]
MQIFRNLRMLVLLFESTYNFDIVKVSPVLDAYLVLQSLHILINTRHIGKRQEEVP